jgi:sigma-B regulation protein RsbU (phosphoserine phosphatase)
VTRLERLLPALAALSGTTVRVWRHDGRQLRLLVDEPNPPPAPSIDTLVPIPELQGTWLQVVTGKRGSKKNGAGAKQLASIIGAVLGAEKDAVQVAAELSERYEEIDLIYTISEILGHTIDLEEGATRILREVATVVRARRATLLVYDENADVLKPIAARGVALAELVPVEVDDPCSIAARVFREMKIFSYDPSDAMVPDPGCGEERGYKGRAFISVPVVYGAPGGTTKPIGVINLTDRLGADAFTAGDRKLVAAIANQIGAAVENARLVERDQGQQRVRRELELAHDLQLKLMPSPLVIAAKADVAARCRSADSVGGDFYNLLSLHGDRIGVMIGDVSSHGFGAALIMALAMAASGIHAETAESPSEALRQMEGSLAEELAHTEMFLSLFYAVIDPAAGRIAYANAGHPHAFLVDGPTGDAIRLEATRPPLGLGVGGEEQVKPWRRREAILTLFTDGLVDARNESGERFGEERVLSHVRNLRKQPAREILEAVFTDIAAFTGGAAASDDRTLVLLKA